MKTSCFSVALVTLAASAIAVAQGPSARVFDNFDRSQGVQVFSPPPLKAEAIPIKKLRSRDKLVRKTAQTSVQVRVTDGLAQRESVVYPAPTTLAMGTATSLKGFTTGNLLHDNFIVESSRRYGIDPLLIYAQMHQESSFKIRATSHKGASGLMQLMPATARRFGVTQIYDPRQNIDAGVKYMRWLLDTFRGDVILALAGYNAGEGAVMKYGWRVPPYRETQEYVRRITSRYGMISDGRYVQTARRITTGAEAKLTQKDPVPLNIYEASPLTVTLADGRMMLVNQ
jgi:hypothetical protein